MSPPRIHVQTIDSPVGPILIAASDEGVHIIEFEHPSHPIPRTPDWIDAAHALIDQTRKQLEDYFAGRRRDFDLPLAPRGTPFQLTVWQALREIGYGETWSYADLARRIGKPTATRAVGAANGRNPLPIVVPCHRVIGADGSLTGFGGGLPVKRFLLQLEGALQQGELVMG